MSNLTHDAIRLKGGNMTAQGNALGIPPPIRHVP